MKDDCADSKRVAIVVVHGVADQRPGDTARSVVDLLVASSLAESRYEAVAQDGFVLAVPPLAPMEGAARASAATPDGASRSLFKGLLQSGRSDFQRAGWEAPTTLAEARHARGGAAGRSSSSSSEVGHGEDRGIAATNYLLAKSIENGAAAEAYESIRIEIERSSPEGRDRVDLYEMYWADLSRLSGAVPRIVSELLTMVFRLSKLGRETVDEARRQLGGASQRPPASWRWFAGLQIALDWGFVNGLAALFAQLGLLAIAVVVFGAALPVEGFVGRIAGGIVLVVALLWSLYRRRDAARAFVVPGVLVLVGLLMLMAPVTTSWLVALLCFAVITIGYDAALRAADDRFPFVRVVGLAFWGLALAIVLFDVIRRVGGGGESPGLAVWLQAVLLGVEFALWGIKLWWLVAAPLLIAWLVSGALAARHGGHTGAASVGTGRLGFFVSLGTFVMLTVACWTLVSSLLELSVKRIDYLPALFPAAEVIGGRSDASIAAASCALNGSAGMPVLASAATALSTAQRFLVTRYEDHASFFSPVSALMLLLVAYLAAMFLPSILAELKLLRIDPRADPGGARRLGRWLTAGYRCLDRAVLIVVVAAAVAAPAVVYVLLFGRGGPLQVAAFSGATDCIAYVSQTLLKPLVLGAAGVATALTALGGILSRTIPGLRAPLDIALDVDNYFREFPRRNIPRARIFSRFAALLDHIATQGYARVVIVSHSQGTVISAELLRFLSTEAADRGSAGRAERLRQRLGTDVHLLTLGSPLRQLYAARFPSLYGWVLAAHAGGNGPRAADIGAERWANAFTSGDYVGRWLWSSPRSAGDAIGASMADTVHPASFGRVDAYSSFDPMPPAVHSLATARELEVCLGAGAHTHYFEPGQATVAWLIDHLVASPALRRDDERGDEAAAPAIA